jgi:hypothetical protein
VPFGYGDLDETNFYTFYGRFKEIGLLKVVAVFICLQYFGLGAPLGIEEKKIILKLFWNKL